MWKVHREVICAHVICWGGQWVEGMNRCENWQVQAIDFWLFQAVGVENPVSTSSKSRRLRWQLLFIKKGNSGYSFDMMSFHKPSCVFLYLIYVFCCCFE